MTGLATIMILRLPMALVTDQSDNERWKVLWEPSNRLSPRIGTPLILITVCRKLLLALNGIKVCGRRCRLSLGLLRM